VTAALSLDSDHIITLWYKISEYQGESGCEEDIGGEGEEGCSDLDDDLSSSEEIGREMFSLLFGGEGEREMKVTLF